jgi:hypothetical protein
MRFAEEHENKVDVKALPQSLMPNGVLDEFMSSMKRNQCHLNDEV